MHDDAPPIPFWMIGLLGAFVLIGISIFMQQTRTVALSDQFARQPTPILPLPALPQLEVQNLSPEIQEMARNLWRQIGAGIVHSRLILLVVVNGYELLLMRWNQPQMEYG